MSGACRARREIYITLAAVFCAGISCRGRSLGTTDQNPLPDPFPCRPGICPGYCGPDKRCHEGASDEACGTGGEQCADCSALQGVCSGGECINTLPCGPETCPGCCDGQGNCLAGASDIFCGKGGEECVDCGDKVCLQGRCVEGCHDQDGDGYGPGCPLGPDCDDTAPGITGPCDENGCPQGWAFIPEGTFTMGCTDPEDLVCEASPYEIPPQEVYLDSFCIQLTEVPVQDFRACQKAGYCDALPDWSGGDVRCNWSLEGPSFDRPDHPMNCMEWFRAKDFCERWVGGDLPLEHQWEKAARGTDARIFPWGNEYVTRPCEYCNSVWCLGADLDTGPYTWPVGYLEGPQGDSPYGLKDMCGNVLELTRSRWKQFGAEVTMDMQDDRAMSRGGTGIDPPGSYVGLFCTYYRVFGGLKPQGDSHPMYGFRCIREPVE